MRHWLIKLTKFQVYDSMIHHMYIVLCAYHPKSSLLPHHLPHYAHHAVVRVCEVGLFGLIPSPFSLNPATPFPHIQWF